jgi:hypothetical protein
MAVNFNFNYSQPIPPPQQQLDALKAEKQKLLARLQQIETEELQLKRQLDRPPAPVQVPKVVSQAAKAEEIAKPYLFVDTTKTAKTQDIFGKEFEHYSVSLITKSDDKVEMTYPIDVSKYGELNGIVIDDGVQKTVLKTDFIYVERLIKYLSTNFDDFRKDINRDKLDTHGNHPNRFHEFDCQRLSYYLHHGKDGDYRTHSGETKKRDYRNKAKHLPCGFYSLHGFTQNFGINGSYSHKDITNHHYMCLTDKVFVSKFGKNESAVFCSYSQILDAYFPPEFVEGYFTGEYH